MPLPTIQLADLGALSKLPPELVLMVIGYLDVPSAAKFTLVNRRAQFLLWSDKDYQLIRYCLFRELFTKVDDPESRDQLRGCSPFTDINYHTLAATIRKPVCEDCNTHEKGTYSLNARTGSYLCYSRCRTDQSVCVIIYVQMIKHHLEQVNTKRLYRLLEGQLITQDPIWGRLLAIPEAYGECFQDMMKKCHRMAWETFKPGLHIRRVDFRSA